MLLVCWLADKCLPFLSMDRIFCIPLLRWLLVCHPFHKSSYQAFNFDGQSLKLPDECGPTISDHTKQHCRKKRSMITPEA